MWPKKEFKIAKSASRVQSQRSKKKVPAIVLSEQVHFYLIGELAFTTIRLDAKLIYGLICKHFRFRRRKTDKNLGRRGQVFSMTAYIVNIDTLLRSCHKRKSYQVIFSVLMYY